MIGIFVVVMIGLCLAIMEQGARKAHITTKGWCMDKQPKVGKGDRVRITKDSVYGQTGKYGTVTRVGSWGLGFDFKPDGREATYWMSGISDEWEILKPTKEQTMAQQTFKPGDKVRVKTNISSCIMDLGMTGVIKDDHYSIEWPYWVQLDDGKCNCFKSEHLEPARKTLDDLVEGDVVVDKDDTDGTLTIAHVLKPGLYVIEDDDALPLVIHTATQLENLDYVPQQDPEDDETSLTVAEVAKKLGLNPDKLHIVADKEAE